MLSGLPATARKNEILSFPTGCSWFAWTTAALLVPRSSYGAQNETRNTSWFSCGIPSRNSLVCGLQHDFFVSVVLEEELSDGWQWRIELHAKVEPTSGAWWRKWKQLWIWMLNLQLKNNGCGQHPLLSLNIKGEFSLSRGDLIWGIRQTHSCESASLIRGITWDQW